MCAATADRRNLIADPLSAATVAVVEWLEGRCLFAAGDIDAAFAGGFLTRDFALRMDFGRAVAVQADDRVLVTGSAASGTATGDDFGVVRFNTDGTLDTTFGGTGMVLTDFGWAGDGAYAMALQGDGKIVVAGQTYRTDTSLDVALVRYNADGTLDTTFGTGGKVIVDLGNSAEDHTTGIAITPDGHIVIAGWTINSGNWQFAAARFTSAGELDTGFDGDGIAVTAVPGGYGQATSVAALADNSIIVAGSATDSSTDASDFAAVHYLADGSVDTAFGNNGWARADLGGDIESANAVAIQPDGRIVLAGESLDSEADTDDFGVVRLLASGQLDTSFGGAGFVLTDFASDYDWASSAIVQGDGKIVVAGTSTVDGRNHFAVARYNGDGSLDGDFGAGGIVSVDYGNDAYAQGIAIDSQQRLVIGGNALGGNGTFDYAAARLIGHTNIAPFASAAGPYTVTAGGSLVLDGSQSTDPDGSLVAYEWDLDYDGTTFDVDATGATPTFSAAGFSSTTVLTIALRVIDDSGAASVTTTTITIEVPPPDPTPAPGTVTVTEDPADPAQQILLVQGTAGDDAIQLNSGKGGQVSVLLNGVSLGAFSNVSRIIVQGDAGDDVLDARMAGVAVALFGEAGADQLRGGDFSDILIGGDGNDAIDGGAGDDLGIGGIGADSLDAREGDDLLIAGAVSFEDDLTSLEAILAEWTRSDLSLTSRMSHLLNGGGFNGSTILGGGSVIGDSDTDVLRGTSGSDWLLNDEGDRAIEVKIPPGKAKQPPRPAKPNKTGKGK